MNLRVRNVCKEKGITMRELSTMLGIAATSLTRNLNGNPTLVTLEKVAKALNVSIVDLFEKEKSELNGIIIYKGETYELTTVKQLKELADSLLADS